MKTFTSAFTFLNEVPSVSIAVTVECSVPCMIPLCITRCRLESRSTFSCEGGVDFLVVALLLAAESPSLWNLVPRCLFCCGGLSN